MTVVRHLASATPTDDLAAVGRRGVAGVLTIWLVLLVALPARLTLAQFGAPSVLLGLGLLVLWVATALAEGRLPAGRQPMRWALLAFLLVLAIGYLVAVRRVLTPAEAGAANRTLVAYTAAIGVAVFAADALADRDDLMAFIRRLVWAGAFLAALGTLHGLAGIELASHIDLPLLTWNADLAVGIERVSLDRVVATATHPIEYGVALTMILPFAVHLAITDHQQRATRWWLLSILMGSAALYSISRSAALGLGIAAVATFGALPSARARWRFGLAFIGLALIIQAVAPGVIGTVRGLFLSIGEDNSYQARVIDYGAVDHYVEDTLWTGRGLGTFLPEQYLLLDNQMLKLVLEIGILGAAAFLVLLTTGFLVGRTIRRCAVEPRWRDLGRTLQVVVVISVVSCFTFDLLGFTIARSLLFLNLGLLGATWRIAGLGTDGPPTAPRRPTLAEAQ